jgi:4-amino-4-deoxy-L-arabinose transferase-like glycosyltransferase
MRNRIPFILIVICILAAALRLFSLASLPNGFHVDELDAGYIGRYIIENGRDITGRVLPLYYDKFGDFRPTGIFYLTGLSVKLFGSTPFAVRLPAALLGIATVVAIYGLAYELFRSRTASLSAAAAVALSPWHIVLSRATSEGIAGLFFVTAGLWLSLAGLNGKNGKQLIRGIVLMLVSYLFYHPFRIVVPAFAAMLMLHPAAAKWGKRTVLSGLGISIILTLILSLTSAGTGRLSQVAFYTNPLVTGKTDTLLGSEGAGHIIQARIFHNKGVIYLREFIVQYSKYFSPEYLFLNGGLPYRYTVPEQGLIPIVSVPLILMGLYGLFRKKDAWPFLITGILLAAAPIPAALTYEDTPNVHRSMTMIIPLALLIGSGMDTLITITKRKWIRIAAIGSITIILTAETAYFWHQYAVHSPSLKPFYRQDGYLEAAALIAKRQGNTDGIYVTGYEHMPLYVLFAEGDYSFRTFGGKSNDVLIDRIGPVRFFHSWCPDNVPAGGNKTIVISGSDCKLPPGTWKTEKIMRKDSTEAFSVGFGQ